MGNRTERLLSHQKHYFFAERYQARKNCLSLLEKKGLNYTQATLVKGFEISESE